MKKEKIILKLTLKDLFLFMLVYMGLTFIFEVLL